MAMQHVSIAMGERIERRGSIALVLLVAAALIAAAGGLMAVGRGQAGSYVLILLTLLGVIGVFSLFALAAGLLRVSGRDPGPSLADAVIEQAEEGVMVTDERGRVLYANAPYRQFAEATGTEDARPLERVLVGDPELSEAVYRLLKAAKEGRRLQEEVRVAGPPGAPGRWLRLRVRPLDGAGPARSVWTVADTSRDRERQENVFQDLERAFRYLDHAPAGFFSVDGKGDIGYINATLAAWLDYDLAQVGVGGLRLRDIVPGESRALFTTLSALPGDVKTEVLDLDLIRRDGRPLPVRIYHKVAFAADGSPGDSCTLVLRRSPGGEGADPLRTAEVQRELQRRFDQSQRMEQVGVLAGKIAHDFNNLLTSITMATGFLLADHKPSDKSFQDLKQIEQDTNRAASLVRQLLAFSRQQTLRPQVLDLGDVMSEVSMLLRRLIGERVTLDVEHGRNLWPVKADQTQFEQVVVNLATNAKDAMPEGGKLTLRTANVSAEQSRHFGYQGMPAAEYVLIEVADTGTGIPLEIRDRVYDPFFTTKEVGKGTGLGLAAVYGIVKQTGGFVYFDSTVGKGTSFRIFLPRHVPDIANFEAADASRSAAAEPIRPGGGAVATHAPADDTGCGTILLVEDEEGLRKLNARGLASRGYTVLQAANGVEAVEIFEGHRGRIDLVVSDVAMPEMDGPTLLKTLRERDPKVKIIFVSGYAGDALKHLPDGQPYNFLAKPFTLKQLVGAVKETAGR